VFLKFRQQREKDQNRSVALQARSHVKRALVIQLLQATALETLFFAQSV
jgi:hypothetical protein